MQRKVEADWATALTIFKLCYILCYMLCYYVVTLCYVTHCGTLYIALRFTLHVMYVLHVMYGLHVKLHVTC